MKYLLVYLRPYRVSIVWIVIGIFSQSLANLYLPTLMSQMVDKGVLKGDIRFIWSMGGLMLVVSVAAVFLSVGAGLLSSRTAAAFGRDLRADVFSHVEQFSLAEFDEFGTSSLITRATNDVTQVQRMVNMMLRMMIMAPLNFIGGIIMAVYTDAKLSLVIVVMVPLLSLVIYVVFGRASRLFRALQTKIDALGRVLREQLTGIRVVRSFNRIDYETRRFDRTNADLTETTAAAQRMMATLMPLLMLIINFATVAILWFGGVRIGSGAMQIGSLMAFIQYAMQLLFSIMMVSMMFFMIPRAAASATRISEVLRTEPNIVDGEMTRADVVKPMTNHGRCVSFHDVTFRYAGAEQPALSDVSFTAEAGEVTAIIGGTGSGKSTLVSLIARFYDVENGSVAIDGVDVRTFEQQRLRAMLGVVPQTAVLFTGTVAENLRYGKENATEDELKRVCEVAQASEFIDVMPNGLEAVIEQGGRNLSGGQKQRLAIARALVRKPDIYIFDDSFSALDFQTDALLRAALQVYAHSATTLIVAQRINTVRNADKIVVLNEGRVVGVGSHETLMNSCEVYKEIVASQLSEGESA